MKQSGMPTYGSMHDPGLLTSNQTTPNRWLYGMASPHLDHVDLRCGPAIDVLLRSRSGTFVGRYVIV